MSDFQVWLCLLGFAGFVLLAFWLYCMWSMGLFENLPDRKK